MNNILESIRHFIRPIRILCVEFCDNSNIHGLRYLTERFLHWSERLWWIIALSVSLWLCGSAAHNIWIDWRDNPMTLSYSEPSVPLSEIPFPTITICPEIKTKKLIFDLGATLKSSTNLTPIERQALNNLAHICPRLHDNIKNKDIFADESIYDILEYIAPPYKEALGPKFNTDNLVMFRHALTVPVFTEEGFCFTYNSLNSHDIYTDEMVPRMMIVRDNINASNWSLEKDFQDKSATVRYPIHEVRVKSLFSLSGNLKVIENDFENQCKGIEHGFRVSISTPGDALKFSEDSYGLKNDAITILYIKPKLTITSEGLRKYNPKQRQCFFDFERRLRFFKIYSQRNCEAECLANFTSAECECVKFSQPRDKRTKICGAAKINCYKTAEQMWFSEKNKIKSFRDKCNCLPSCTSIKYEITTDEITIDINSTRKTIRSYRPHAKFTSARFAQLRILIKEEQVGVVKRIESHTWSDFLAFCGGLLGLFLGFSALSMVEIIYYLTLRLYWIIFPLGVSNAVIPFQQQTSTNIFDRFRFLHGIRAFIVEYCDNSSIHGFVYFTRRGLHWIERLWWIIAFGFSLWLCTLMNINVWNEWQENPVKMRIFLKERPISHIPFPTVTICPMTKSMKHKLDLNALVYGSSNSSAAIRAQYNNEKFGAIVHICRDMQLRIGMHQLFTFPPNAEENIYDILQDIAPQLSDVMHKCTWQGEVVDCSMYMIPNFADDGYCFTFNALNSHEIYTNEYNIPSNDFFI